MLLLLILNYYGDGVRYQNEWILLSHLIYVVPLSILWILSMVSIIFLMIEMGEILGLLLGGIFSIYFMIMLLRNLYSKVIVVVHLGEENFVSFSIRKVPIKGKEDIEYIGRNRIMVKKKYKGLFRCKELEELIKSE